SYCTASFASALICSSLLSRFFFSCYGDLRALHSFPTRRSSDLGGVVPSTRRPVLGASTAHAPRTNSTPSVRWHASAGQRSNDPRSEEHTSELQSLAYLVCRLLLEKKKK